ncbi:MAG TPA: hypothetical protein VLW49_07195 [Gaiellaceae bacterium]|nr:hypothetical protein [Gaiellaceae bacterium]
MPMLHGCAFPGCSTLTLSTYCVEHELLIRAAKQSERHPDPEPPAETALETRADAAADAETQEPAAR